MNVSYAYDRNFLRERFYNNGTLSLRKIRCFLSKLNLNQYPSFEDIDNDLYED